MTTDDEQRPGSDDQWSEWCEKKPEPKHQTMPGYFVSILSGSLRTNPENWSYDQRFTIVATLHAISYRGWTPAEITEIIHEITGDHARTDGN